MYMCLIINVYHSLVGYSHFVIYFYLYILFNLYALSDLFCYIILPNTSLVMYLANIT